MEYVLTTKIYRKETHTNRYLNYESCHSQQLKQDIIISLLNRSAKLITDSKDFKEEKKNATTYVGRQQSKLACKENI